MTPRDSAIDSPRWKLQRLLGGDVETATFLDSMHLGAAPTIEELSGGVSSELLQIRSDDRCVVVKRALEELRVAEKWRSRPERSLVEARCALILGELVPESVPTLIEVMPERMAFAMSCAPDGSVAWKADLMRGVVDPRLAARVGTLLGRIHAASAVRPGLAIEFGDHSFFDELRLDAYFRHLQAIHPDLTSVLDGLVEALDGPGICLVHGDFSPKNLLVSPAGDVLLVDHEAAHWGQPAFDLGFVVTHLCLKAVLFPRRATDYLDAASTLVGAYRLAAGPTLAAASSSEFGGQVLGGLLLARIDGKSPIEYLTSESDRNLVRGLSRSVLIEGVADVDAVIRRVAEAVA